MHVLVRGRARQETAQEAAGQPCGGRTGGSRLVRRPSDRHSGHSPPRQMGLRMLLCRARPVPFCFHGLLSKTGVKLGWVALRGGARDVANKRARVCARPGPGRTGHRRALRSGSSFSRCPRREGGAGRAGLRRRRLSLQPSRGRCATSSPLEVLAWRSAAR